MREAGMSSEAKRKREKLREKRNQRKLRNQAKKKLDDEERADIRASLQSKSKHEAMQQMVPSSRTVTPASKALAKKICKSKVLSKHKMAAKNKKKDETKKAALALVKQKENETQKALAHAPPLPPPVEAPPEADEPEKKNEPKQAVPGVFRVVRDMAGLSLFGRQGSVMATGDNEWQVFLDEVNKAVPSKLVWVKRDYLQKIEAHEAHKR